MRVEKQPTMLSRITLKCMKVAGKNIIQIGEYIMM